MMPALLKPPPAPTPKPEAPSPPSPTRTMRLASLFLPAWLIYQKPPPPPPEPEPTPVEPVATLEDIGIRAQQEVAKLCKYVEIDMVQRLIKILKPIHFQGSKHAGGVDVYLDPPLAAAICKDVASALQICNDMLAQQGSAPLGLTVEGHTSASMNGHAESERISGLRALQCAKSISGSLRDANPGAEAMWGKQIEKAISHIGMGSTVRLPGFDDGGNYSENRRVEMRLVVEGEPGYFVGGSVPSLTSLAPESPNKSPKGKGSKSLLQLQRDQHESQRKLRHGHTARDGHRFHLVNDPSKSVVEQLREQIKSQNIRMREAFQEMDEDGDGHISKSDWRGWMQTIGPDLPPKALNASFDELDVDGSGVIEMLELEAFIKGRKPPAASLVSQARTSAGNVVSKAASKVPVPVVPRAVVPRVPTGKNVIPKKMAVPSFPSMAGMAPPKVLPSCCTNMLGGDTTAAATQVVPKPADPSVPADVTPVEEFHKNVLDDFIDQELDDNFS